jgi:hypothetical protein
LKLAEKCPSTTDNRQNSQNLKILFGFSLFSFIFSRTSGDKELTVSDNFDNSYNKLMS